MSNRCSNCCGTRRFMLRCGFAAVYRQVLYFSRLLPTLVVSVSLHTQKGNPFPMILVRGELENNAHRQTDEVAL